MSELTAKLTAKQAAWNKAKSLSRLQEKALRKGMRAVPCNPEAPDEKKRKRARRCPHTRKHHTAAGGCRKCDRSKPAVMKRFRRFA